MDDGRKRRWFRRRPDSESTAASVPLTDPADPAGPVGPAGPADAATRAAVEEAPPEPTDQQVAEMLARLSDYVYVQVRSGIYELPELRELTLQAASEESADPERADEMARQVLSRELQSWREDAERWGPRTDCDRLDRALSLLHDDGILVQPGLLDDASLAESIRIRGVDDGCVTYLVSDIWRAIDTNSLNLTVIDSDGERAARRSPLIRQVIDALGAAGLLASAGPVEGQVDVALVWRRRPPR